MGLAEEFPDIVTREFPLKTLLPLKLGGSAEFFARVSHSKQLTAILASCHSQSIVVRVVGGGSNILVPDEGIRGLVIQLDGEEFRTVRIEGKDVHAGAGVSLADVVGETCRAGLSGLESLIGIPGQLGGAVCHNAGGRTSDIGQVVQAVDVVDFTGKAETRTRGDLRFGYRSSNLNECVIVAVRLQLVPESADDIVRRLKKIWIDKQAHQPFSFERACLAFRNPRGLSASELIEKAGARILKVGGAEISERDARYIIAGENATSRDVRQLIELTMTRVEEQTGVRLELHVDRW